MLKIARNGSEWENTMFEATANEFGLTEGGANVANHVLKQLSELGIVPSKQPRACIAFPVGDIIVTVEPEARRMRMWHRTGVLERLVLLDMAPQDAGAIQDFVHKTQQDVEPAASTVQAPSLQR